MVYEHIFEYFQELTIFIIGMFMSMAILFEARI